MTLILLKKICTAVPKKSSVVFSKHTKNNQILMTQLFDLRAPTGINCLAPYGGPVIPGVAMGGASQTDHLDAVGVTLTFIVANSVNQDDLKGALAWEQAY